MEIDDFLERLQEYFPEAGNWKSVQQYIPDPDEQDTRTKFLTEICTSRWISDWEDYVMNYVIRATEEAEEMGEAARGSWRINYLDLDYEKERGYWEGPYGCRVDYNIKSVVWKDGISSYKRNRRLGCAGPYPLTKEAWLELYTRENEDGILCYVSL